MTASAEDVAQFFMARNGVLEFELEKLRQLTAKQEEYIKELEEELAKKEAQLQIRETLVSEQAQTISHKIDLLEEILTLAGQGTGAERRTKNPKIEEAKPVIAEPAPPLPIVDNSRRLSYIQPKDGHEETWETMMKKHNSGGRPRIRNREQYIEMACAELAIRFSPEWVKARKKDYGLSGVIVY